MKLISQIKEMENKILEKISFNESLSKFSWFNLGGPAKVLFRPQNLKELSIFLKKIKGNNEIKILGAGSNTLIRDGGFDGIIIKFGKSFSRISLFDSNTIIAGVSASDKNVSDFALENSLSGFEFLSCIPGCIGGAVRMNSGCYEEDISGILISVQAIDFNGNIKIIQSSDIKFHYRGSSLDNNLIFISATFKGKKNNKSNIKKKIINFVKRKKNAQPSKIKTCGSTFKNPENKKAWKLIKDSGCAGMQVGDAQISKKHCNFFINKGNAKSEDLEKLINQVQNKILDKTGINLELEIQIIGEKL
ncbi:MAG TPA: UDP-N-acetylmuramate dehydrogenase [Pelagibacteraceae bacterium]|jgi:UDP-N-acetylmuramate dehydrogenase|nr:UDP-N-acetylmuramate dehydrogenase [Pelagibacteraceae bacterium]